MEKHLDVHGIGNPLIDVLSQVDYDFLEELKVEKGIMQLIDQGRRAELLDSLDDFELSPGGSCANTMITLADLGLEVSYAGGLGDDQFGNQFEEGTEKLGVISAMKRKTLPTGSSTILVTPDADRTLNTYLGACQEFEKSDIDQDKIQSSKFLYFTGYMWDTKNQINALEHAIDVAESAGTKIIFDVADPFAVNRSKDAFIKIIQNHAYFVLANMAEARMLTGKEDREDIVRTMMKYSPRGVVKDGKHGAYIYFESDIVKINSISVKAVDTTGAGDIFAAGILYGIIKDYDLLHMGRIASFLGGKVVEHVGARLNQSYRGFVDRL